MNQPTPTTETFATWQAMFDHFNATLWAGKLPHVIINMSRKRGARAFFWAGQWAKSEAVTSAAAVAELKDEASQRLAEISMNPDSSARDPKDVAGTFAHEMAHLWDHVFGKPGKGGYHGRSWANEMKRIGLQPVSLDQPGKETGHRVTHNIVEGGAFDLAFASLPSKACPWVKGSLALPADPIDPNTLARNQAKRKVAYECECSKAWGKPGMSLHCNECDTEMVEQ